MRYTLGGSPYSVRRIGLGREGKVKEALELYERSAPTQYIKNWMATEKSLRGLYMKENGLEVRYLLSRGLWDLLNRTPRRTLVLVGGSGSGKSQMLEAFCKLILGEAPLIINLLDWLIFYNGQKVILADDIELPRTMSREMLKKFLESQDRTTISIKHSCLISRR